MPIIPRPAGTRRAALVVATLLLAGCSVFGGQAADEPSFTVTVSEPPFEIREYAAMAVVETTVAGDFDAAVSTGFRRLFRYISGENGGNREIAMTAPVLAAPEGDTIAMTAPVLTAPGAGGWTVAFVLPAEMTEATAPLPADPTVRLATVPARRVAVARYAGFFTEAAAEERRAALLAWLEARGETPAGPWSAAGYNPPWTLPPLRRNEVLVPLAP